MGLRLHPAMRSRNGQLAVREDDAVTVYQVHELPLGQEARIMRRSNIKWQLQRTVLGICMSVGGAYDSAEAALAMLQTIINVEASVSERLPGSD